MAKNVKSSPMTESAMRRLAQSWLAPHEAAIIKLQSFISWESPIYTLALIAGLNMTYWAAIVYGLRPFFLIPFCGAVYIFLDAWWNRIWPEIRMPPEFEDDSEEWTPVHPRFMSVPEIAWYLAKAWCLFVSSMVSLWKLRRRSSWRFCLLTSTILITTVTIGHYISGQVLIYCILMAVFLWPAFEYNGMRKRIGERLTQFLGKLDAAFSFTSGNPDTCDEFMLKVTHDIEHVLNEAVADDDDVDSILPTIPPSATSSTYSMNGCDLRYPDRTIRERSLADGLPTDFPSIDAISDDENELDLPLDTEPVREHYHSDEIRFITSHFKEIDNLECDEDVDMSAMEMPSQLAESREESDYFNTRLVNMMTSGMKTISNTVMSAANKLQPMQQQDTDRLSRDNNISNDIDAEFEFLDAEELGNSDYR